jgi:ferredoxin
MATLEIDGQIEEVPDGGAILDACYDLGVPFSCQAGECATCVIDILEGLDNLEPHNSAERGMGLTPAQRLACQARIRTGHVRAAW